MKSKRLKAILAYLSPEDCIIDVGCDHAYIAIEIAKLGCKKVLATDISQGAIQIAKRNIEQQRLSKIIKTQRCDGLKGIDENAYNTIVIAGMGASTMMDILMSASLKTIEKIILQSNNDLEELRRFMTSLDYHLADETVVLEKKHYYTIMKYEKGRKELEEIEYQCGLYKSENKDYYEYLNHKLEEILEKLPTEQDEKRAYIEAQKERLQTYLNKENRTI
ncbi:MAG: SAM-dependent methyltransferase [Bacilli bacterium]|nr:SAM-dependent methyltransferase [Bacilli bacterium]